MIYRIEYPLKFFGFPFPRILNFAILDAALQRKFPYFFLAFYITQSGDSL